MSWLYTWWIDLARAIGLREAFQYPFVARGVVAILCSAGSATSWSRAGSRSSRRRSGRRR